MTELKKHHCALFDLDGVIVDTAQHHFLAWKKIAEQFDYELTEKDNQQLKGISRIDSLKLILKMADRELDQETFQTYLKQKNENYLELIQQISPQDMLPGVPRALHFLKENNIKIGLGSASKNALTILDKLQITPYFQTIVNGNSVQHSKPHPEVFLKGSEALGVAPEKCVVFEDSQAGIQAAKAGGMTAVAIGKEEQFYDMDYCFEDFEAIDAATLKTLF
jgi:beta-phosphoglucomutase